MQSNEKTAWAAGVSSLTCQPSRRVNGARHAAAALEMLNIDVAVHSQGELGISMAAQLHLAASLPALPHAPDAHYHHLTDDVIAQLFEPKFRRLHFGFGCVNAAGIEQAARADPPAQAN